MSANIFAALPFSPSPKLNPIARATPKLNAPKTNRNAFFSRST